MRIIIELSVNGQIEGVFVAYNNRANSIDVEGVHNVEQLIAIAMETAGVKNDFPELPFRSCPCD
jgi:hypothetical protein